MTKYGFAINLFRCIGCRTCAVSCKMENKVADGIQRMHVLNDAGTTTLDTPSGTYPNVMFNWRPVPCQHCQKAPCIEVCPTGATYKRKADGVVVVDKDVCIGCGACVGACPYGARTMEEEAKKVDKCELCIHRLSNGVPTTMCQISCPNRAIMVGDLDDPKSEISQVITRYETERYKPDSGAEPNIFYYHSVKPSRESLRG